MVERLKTVRKTLALSQQSFADKMGISQSTLAMIEANKRPASPKTIRLVCATFGVNETWLRTGEGEMFNTSPYSDEFIKIFERLSPLTQEYLLKIGKNLLEMQEKDSPNK